MALTFHTERFDDVIEELLPLLRKHYEEVAWNKSRIPLDPDYERYRQIESSGSLRIYVVREDGAIIGYAVFLVSRHLHYNIKLAVNDIVYVDPTRRGVMVGQKLLRDFAESELKREGVQVISLHIKLNHDWSKLAELWGYAKVDMICNKWIGE